MTVTSITAQTEHDWLLSLSQELDETLIVVTDHGVEAAWAAKTKDGILLVRIDGYLFIDSLGSDDWEEINLTAKDANEQRDAVLAVIREGR